MKKIFKNVHYQKALFIMLFLIVTSVKAQETQGQFVGLSFGTAYRYKGIEFDQGIKQTVSFQKSFLQNKLRVSPQFSLGVFNNLYGGDQFENKHYATFSGDLNVYFNYLTIKSSSFFVGAGLNFTQERGMIYYSQGPFAGDLGRYKDEFLNVNGCLFGYRLLYPNRKLGMEIKVLNYSINSLKEKILEEESLNLGLIIKI